MPRKLLFYLIWTLLGIAGVSPSAEASIALIGLDEMVKQSSVIAVVELRSTENGRFVGPESERFTRRHTVNVVQVLKGEWHEEATIHDGSGRWDALFQNVSLRMLVFLKGSPSFLIGTHGWQSSCRIEGDQFVWRGEGGPRLYPLQKLKTR